jgi:hypothetical protein
VEFRAGTILIGHFGGVGGGTVRIFLSFSLALQWRVRHGRIGQGGGPFFLCFLQFAVCSFGGWVSAVGNFCVIYFLLVVCSIFFLGFLFYKSLIVNNLLQVVSPKSEP